MSQINVEIAASADDSNRFRVDTVYPPIAGAGGNQNTNTFLVGTKGFTTPNYTVQNEFVRFDTSIIPDTATITQASLRFVSSGVTNPDTRSVNFEWYSWTPPLVAGDYTDLVGTTANVTALSAIPGGAVAVDFQLSDPDANISKTGFTGIRFGISGGAPTGVNEAFLAAWDHTTSATPKLTVTYTEFMGSASAAWLTA